MAWVFHQNMRTWTGTPYGGVNPVAPPAPARDANRQYGVAFGGLRPPLPRGRIIGVPFVAPPAVATVYDDEIVVAGFTEVISAVPNGPSATLTYFADRYFSRANAGSRAVVVAAGQSLLAKQPEFVGITVHPYITLEAYGQMSVVEGAANGTIDVRPTWVAWPAGKLQHTHLDEPADAVVDYRGVVCVVVTDNVARYVIGFVHAPFTQKDNLVMTHQMLVKFYAKMKDPSFGGAKPVVDQVIIGGDFNVDPPPAGGGNWARQTIEPIFTGVPTTLGGNEYDHWYTGLGQAKNLSPARFTPTQNMALGLSDHTGTLLRV